MIVMYLQLADTISCLITAGLGCFILATSARRALMTRVLGETRVCTTCVARRRRRSLTSRKLVYGAISQS